HPQRLRSLQAQQQQGGGHRARRRPRPQHGRRQQQADAGHRRRFVPGDAEPATPRRRRSAVVRRRIDTAAGCDTPARPIPDAIHVLTRPRENSIMKSTKFLAIAALLGTAVAAKAVDEVTLNGAGATFPNIIYQNWMLAYNQAHSDVKLNYQAIGSGGGIRQFSDGTVDFGGTDAPMSDSAITAIQGNVLHIPTV